MMTSVLDYDSGEEQNRLIAAMLAVEKKFHGLSINENKFPNTMQMLELTL